MKLANKPVAAALLVLAVTVSPVLAKRRPPPPALRITKVTKVVTGACSTDGGSQACPTGVKYLGEVIKSSWNGKLTDAPLACADGAAGAVTFKIGFEYNEGTVSVLDSDKVQAKWPACIKDFAKQAADAWLGWYKVLQPIDPSIDIRSEYKITVTIGK